MNAQNFTSNKAGTLQRPWLCRWLLAAVPGLPDAVRVKGPGGCVQCTAGAGPYGMPDPDHIWADMSTRAVPMPLAIRGYHTTAMMPYR